MCVYVSYLDCEVPFAVSNLLHDVTLRVAGNYTRAQVQENVVFCTSCSLGCEAELFFSVSLAQIGSMCEMTTPFLWERTQDHPSWCVRDRGRV